MEDLGDGRSIGEDKRSQRRFRAGWYRDQRKGVAYQLELDIYPMSLRCKR